MKSVKLKQRGDHMIFRTPSYYDAFHCTADKCSDNCCIGWEIDIDPDTAAYYNSVEGDFGKRLKENISAENSFILKGERCPFLNENNLCDIIINCGENRLCQICSDHPRYFEWYGSLKEGGIGLSCEEGARLILTSDNPAVTESNISEYEEEIDEELLSFLLSARENLFDILNSDLPLKDKLIRILDSAEKLQFTIDNPHLGDQLFVCDSTPSDSQSFHDILSLFSDFEPIDEGWTQECHSLMKEESFSLFFTETEEKYAVNLLRYFVWRYFLKGVFDEEILSKLKFAVVSLLVIKAMTKENGSLSAWIEKSKLYSKQMEYSEENRELFFDYTYEKQCLSTGNIKALINP